MEWNKQLQEIINYVENHLQRTEDPIDIEEITRIAGCSYGFFQKVFSYMNEMSFAEYVRNRKLTLAGYDLKSTKMKVVDISYKYGYDSPTSFTKAFSLFHGVAPKDAKNKDVELRVFPKMQIDDKQEFAWRIEEKPEIRCIGKKKRISCDNGNNYKAIPEFWAESFRDGTFARLVALDTRKPSGMFGLCTDYDPIKNEINYVLCVASDAKEDDLIEVILPKETWAVFDCTGRIPEAIQNGWRYLNEEWVVQYPFAHADCPEVEWYSEGNSFSDDYLSQIWIPIEEDE
ncbi:MAG: AraC family transcriptional regulator [Anaerorhabdus sp.]|uniref:AraC family transcriptional regulator n=1 Tax=Anaerorhabdus sp. TaxID=1872524 RepID=UPI002FC9CF48